MAGRWEVGHRTPGSQATGTYTQRPRLYLAAGGVHRLGRGGTSVGGSRHAGIGVGGSGHMARLAGAAIVARR